MMTSNPHLRYEDAAEEYLRKLSVLTQPLQDEAGISARGAIQLPAEILTRRAEDIVNASHGVVQLAQCHLDSADPIIRDGIRFHLIDQATVEMLLGIELLQVSQNYAAGPSTAANRATHSAALLEAIDAVEKSSSIPLAQGITPETGVRASDSGTREEAVSGLMLAVESTAGNICRRVQELGGDIAFDLVSGTQWAEVTQGASLSLQQIADILEANQNRIAGKVLLQVYRRIAALLGNDVTAEAQQKIGQWLDEVKRENRIDVFNDLIERFYKPDHLKKLMSRLDGSAATLDSINKACDMIKALSDKFILLISRMRKLEDAIRLGKPVEVPPFRLVTIALQVSLLSALVYAGRDCIGKRIAGNLKALLSDDLRAAIDEPR